MNSTGLNVQGVGVLIKSSGEISGFLEHDYGRYLADKVEKRDLEFNLHTQKPEYISLPKLKASKYHEDYIVYDSGDSRIIDFFGKALVVYETKQRTVDVYCESTDRLYDIFYLSFETLVGEELERLGFARIHCLALEKDGNAVVVLLPPGAGKSTLALKFLEHEKVRVLAEDIALLKEGKLHGLHFRWGTKDEQPKHDGRIMRRGKYADKLLIDARKLELADEAKPSAVVVGHRTLSNESSIKNVGKQNLVLPLFKSMVLGLDLQQSLAYFLLRNYKEAFGKAGVGFARARAVTHMLLKCSAHEFLMGADVDKNYGQLCALVEEVL